MGRSTAEGVPLRPYAHLFRQGLLASLAFMGPVFLVLYVLTIPSGPWLAVVITHAITTIAMITASILFFRTGIWVAADSIVERGYFGRLRRIPVQSVGSILLAETFDGSGTKSLPQLFVVDADGSSLVRMRGQFWSKESMDAVVATLDVPVERLDEVTSTDELRLDRPGLLYWFERHPLIAALVFVASTALFGGFVYCMLRLARVV